MAYFGSVSAHENTEFDKERSSAIACETKKTRTDLVAWNFGKKCALQGVFRLSGTGSSFEMKAMSSFSVRIAGL